MELLKSVGMRFVRGFIAGAVGSMVVINMSVSSFSDLQMFGASLVIAAIAGGVTGGLLAVDKMMRS